MDYIYDLTKPVKETVKDIRGKFDKSIVNFETVDTDRFFGIYFVQMISMNKEDVEVYTSNINMSIEKGFINMIKLSIKPKTDQKEIDIVCDIIGVPFSEFVEGAKLDYDFN